MFGLEDFNLGNSYDWNKPNYGGGSFTPSWVDNSASFQQPQQEELRLPDNFNDNPYGNQTVDVNNLDFSSGDYLNNQPFQQQGGSQFSLSNGLDWLKGVGGQIKDFSQQPAMGNMNWGDIANTALKGYFAKQAYKRQQEGFNNAINQVRGMQDPNVPAYQSRLADMVMNPGMYTQTPESNAILGKAQEAMKRQLIAQGRSANVPAMMADVTAKHGLALREAELNRLTGLAKPDMQGATTLADLYGKLGMAKAEQKRGLGGNLYGALEKMTGNIEKDVKFPNKVAEMSVKQFFNLMAAMGKGV